MGSGLAEVCLLILLAKRGRNMPRVTTKIGKLVVVQKVTNMIIIEIERTQENIGNHQS
jgi:hypothetical protein